MTALRHPTLAASAAGEELDKPFEDVGYRGDPTRSGRCQHRVGLLGLEVAGVLVDLDPRGQAVQVKLRVELGGVGPPANPESLYRTALRVSQRHCVCRQLADRLLVANVRTEGRSGALEKRIFLARPGDLDPDTTDRLGVGSVDNCTLVPTERSDSVARTQEREIPLHNIIQKGGQFGFHSPLRRRLDLVVVAGLKRPAAQDDSGPLIKINGAQRGLLHPDPLQLTFVETSAAKHGSVLVIGGDVLGPDCEHQEGFHVRTLRDRCETAAMFEVRPLTIQTWADLEELFGLPGGSIVRGCWCIYYRKVGRVGVSQAYGPSHKQELRALSAQGRTGSRRLRRRLPPRVDQPRAARGLPQAGALPDHEGRRRDPGLVGSRSLYERAGFRWWYADRRHGWLCGAGCAHAA